MSQNEIIFFPRTDDQNVGVVLENAGQVATCRKTSICCLFWELTAGGAMLFVS